MTTTKSNKQTKTAIVTGGSRGIGAATARKLASQGYNIVVNYQSNTEQAEATVEDLKNLGVDAIAVKANVANKDEIKRLFDEAEAAFSQVDVLVSNAAIQIHKMFQEHDQNDVDTIFDVNAKGAFYLLQEAAERLADNGHIVALSSSLTTMMVPGYGAYNGTKAAVEQFVRSLAKELARRNININAIAPGPVDTELLQNTETPEGLKFLASLSDFQRLGKPSDIANVIAFFCSDESRWVSGQVINANGALI